MMFLTNRHWLAAGLLSLANLTTTASAGAQTAKASGSHSTCETAVVLSAPSHMEGIQKEYEWLRANHPTARLEEQALITCKGKPTDSFTLVDATGATIVVLFDLSGYWGKGI